jgi:hypothetical protein
MTRTEWASGAHSRNLTSPSEEISGETNGDSELQKLAGVPAAMHTPEFFCEPVVCARQVPAIKAANKTVCPE